MRSTYWYDPEVDKPDAAGSEADTTAVTEPHVNRVQVERESDANLIGSLLEDDKGRKFHAPALDLDVRCQLFESREAGHYHLYIDKAVPEDLYFKLLDVLAECHILEPGYVSASKVRGQTFLRPPRVKA